MTPRQSPQLRPVYAGEAPPETYGASIFLVGPSPRGADVSSWRPDALAALAAAGFTGVVYVPEPRDGDLGSLPGGWESQTRWEEQYLSWADVILAWVPRQMPTTPGLTTNFEVGEWLASGKLVLGAPADADSVRYLIARAEASSVPTARTLDETVQLAVQRVGPPAARTGAERSIPLHLWRTPALQSWLTAQRASGHELTDADMQWRLGIGERGETTLLAVVRCAMRVHGEDRIKAHEVVWMRPDTSSVLLYAPGHDLASTRVVLVREYRTPARNRGGFVWELPGGSGAETSARATAVTELAEETGLAIAPERLQLSGARQVAATVSSHHCTLYTAALTPEEISQLEQEARTFGADAEERTTVHLRTIGDLLAGDLTDWATLGMILTALAPHQRH